MSMEHAKAFIERMNTDEAFCNTIMAIKNKDEVFKVIKGAGYECTIDEINILICLSGSSSDDLLY